MSTIEIRCRNLQVEPVPGTLNPRDVNLILYADLTEAQMLDVIRSMQKRITMGTWSRWLKTLEEESYRG